jgi:hypothetical protein
MAEIGECCPYCLLHGLISPLEIFVDENGEIRHYCPICEDYLTETEVEEIYDEVIAFEGGSYEQRG